MSNRWKGALIIKKEWVERRRGGRRRRRAEGGGYKVGKKDGDRRRKREDLRVTGLWIWCAKLTHIPIMRESSVAREA